MDWFRSWHGAPTDDKFLLAAKRAGVAPVVVSGIFWKLLDVASLAQERGSIQGFNPEAYALWAGIEASLVSAVVDALRGLGIIVEDRLANWDKRQPPFDPTAAQRMQRMRARRKAERDVTRNNRNVTVEEIDKRDKKELQRDKPEQSKPVVVGFHPNYRTFVDRLGYHWGQTYIDRMSSGVADEIDGWARITPVEEWDYALKEAKKHNHTSMSYVESILQRVQRDGLPEGEGTAKSNGTNGTVQGVKLADIQ